MQRYFLEVSYKGTAFSGFQIQDNAITIQSEVTNALQTFYRQPFELVGSSRTDAGVHALQNFFHFDINETQSQISNQHLYHLNAIISPDIVLKNIFSVDVDKHCRFNAQSREYKYFIYQHKNPFLQPTAWFYPYTLDISMLNEAAQLLTSYTNFQSFSKKNTQVKTFNCSIEYAKWVIENDSLVFNIQANRFLRGMVRSLVATMLKVGRKQISLNEWKEIIEAQDCSRTDFSAPANGLFLIAVNY
ncbi:MAG: tRNA pseudouridine(38-40) synthase TruA [Bacteroidetes bacterium]|nr:tRNA pseudouridine(38-40) synthase TruA [Bacteroidota bacterium]MBS1649230.1 tRNA pseudouridine(38-40) synthase TruA [Bacteroidota bacterium]